MVDSEVKVLGVVASIIPNRHCRKAPPQVLVKWTFHTDFLATRSS